MARVAGVSTTLSWGHTTYKGLKQIAVRMPEKMFLELKARAIKENKSMQAKLLEYINCGLEVDKDWDNDVPDRHAPNVILPAPEGKAGNS